MTHSGEGTHINMETDDKPQVPGGRHGRLKLQEDTRDGRDYIHGRLKLQEDTRDGRDYILRVMAQKGILWANPKKLPPMATILGWTWGVWWTRGST